jgi:hypothetical protein
LSACEKVARRSVDDGRGKVRATDLRLSGADKNKWWATHIWSAGHRPSSKGGIFACVFFVFVFALLNLPRIAGGRPPASGRRRALGTARAHRKSGSLRVPDRIGDEKDAHGTTGPVQLYLKLVETCGQGYGPELGSCSGDDAFWRVSRERNTTVKQQRFNCALLRHHTVSSREGTTTTKAVIGWFLRPDTRTLA